MLKSTGEFINQKTININRNDSIFIRLLRGNIYLMGRDIDMVGNGAVNIINTSNLTNQVINNRVQRDGDHFHMTLVTKDEISQIQKAAPLSKRNGKTSLYRYASSDDDDDEMITISKNLGTKEDIEGFGQKMIGDDIQIGKDWHVLGIGKDSSHKCFFLVVVFPRGEILREKLGLPGKQFHITLYFQENDVHNCDRGVKSIITSSLESHNRPDNFLLKIISSPVKLVASAEECILGGKPNTSVTKLAKKMKDYKGAGILLDAAEALIKKGNGIYNDDQRIGKGIMDLLVETSQMELVRNMSIIRCQIMGHKREYECMIDCSEFILEVQHKLLVLQRRNTNSSSAQLKYYEVQSELIEATVQGYKGFALLKMKRWSDAYPCLERSYELRSHKTKDKNAMSVTSLLDTKREEESVVVERLLGICCKKVGVRAPLPPLTTFPRTPHLFDSGGTAVTSDDLVISGDSALFEIIGDGKTQVIVEEKIDGANMGFSLSASGEVTVQNRNHYTSSADHSQFGPLTAWVEEHRLSLVKILNPPNNQRRVASHGFILFGEWMVAKHSISYNKLPGRFVAFDLYDRLEKRFYSRSRLHDILMGSGIPCVPIIEVRTFGPYLKNVFRGSKSANASLRKANPLEVDLRKLLDTKSRFRSDSGYVEGVILRIEENPSSNGDQPLWLKHRAKIVRPDFVAGCEEGHWMRNDIVKQQVDLTFANTYMSVTDSYCLASVAPSDESISCGKGFRVTYKDGEPCRNEESINPRRRLLVSGDIEKVQLPRNFSFLWANEVAVSSTPVKHAHIVAFRHAFNIRLIVTLTEEEPLPSSWFLNVDGIDNKFVPVPNYNPPSNEQIDNIINVIEQTVLNGGSVLVQCGGGKGRAGSVASCLLMKYGYEGIRASIKRRDDIVTNGPKVGSDQAIDYIRKTRPGSIETEIQEQFIRHYSSVLWMRADQDDDKKPAASTPYSTSKDDNANGDSKPKKLSKKELAELKAERHHLVLKARAQRRAPRIVILMGLPGSGKSTFCSRLQIASIETDQEPWIIINQDKLGKKACEKLAGSRNKEGKGKRMVLDRCNRFESERKAWLEIMHSPPKNDVALVYCAADTTTCTSRVTNREGHETIPKGKGQRIVQKMAQDMEPPTLHEKKIFGSIHVLKTFDDADSLLQMWGA